MEIVRFGASEWTVYIVVRMCVDRVDGDERFGCCEYALCEPLDLKVRESTDD